VPIKEEYDVTDPIEVDFFLKQLRLNFDYFLDLGANAGYFSALASKYGTFDEIYSFEADKNYLVLGKVLRYLAIGEVKSFFAMG
jgi:protein-L-isoaspartate O-methyltransferase